MDEATMGGNDGDGDADGDVYGSGGSGLGASGGTSAAELGSGINSMAGAAIAKVTSLGHFTDAMAMNFEQALGDTKDEDASRADVEGEYGSGFMSS